MLILYFFSAGAQDPAHQNYFQQEVNYDIRVQLNDREHSLDGNIDITYINRSPDTLHFIWMHLWPNAYSDRNTALSKQLAESGRTRLFFAKENDRGSISKISFTVNNTPAAFVPDPDHNDIGKIILPKPLPPGESAIIQTPFYVKIPPGIYSRLGHIGNSYQVTQWYPKPAVYDNRGWHQMTYLDQGEFYSEFGKFNVKITLPENYIVAATGVLQEPEEIKFLENKAEQTKVLIDFGNDLSFPASSGKFKTITYVQDSIHDFAWFADKRFHVLKDTIVIQNKSIDIWAFFTNREAQLWKKSPAYLKNAIRLFSDRIGSYPFAHFTAVDGTTSAGGGMEYPMITMMNTAGDDFTLEDVLIHEVAHSWFYGILGFNERTEGWLDEGLSSFYELEYINHYYKENAAAKNDLSFNGITGKITGLSDVTMHDGFELTYRYASYDNSDQPINTHSEKFSDFNYGGVMYRKASLAFDFLKNYLGKNIFDQCIQSFYDEWKFRHPSAENLQKSFEKVSGKNLGWFFDNLVTTNDRTDYRLVKFLDSSGGFKLVIENKGNSSVPVLICNELGNCKWYDGFNGTDTLIFPHPMSKTITINKGYSGLLKAQRESWNIENSRPVHGDYKISLYPDFGLYKDKRVLNIQPVVAWNNYNRWMAGVNLTNINILPKKMEWNVAPLYDFRNSDIAGIAFADYHIWPFSGIFSEITISADGKRFAFAENRNNLGELSEIVPVFNYTRATGGIAFAFRKKTHRSTHQHRLAARTIFTIIDEEEFYRINEFNYGARYVETGLNFNELKYTFSNSRTIDPFNTRVNLEQGPHHLKLSGTFNYRFTYAKFNKGVDVRIFAGGFLVNDEKQRNYNYRMSWNGNHDYLFDEYFFGRSETEGILSQQFLVREGGFKIPTFVGQSNKWIAALNLSIDIPYPLPLKFFFDVGTYDGISTVFSDLDNKIMYDGGICLSLGNDFLEIYIPFVKSKDIEKNLETIDLKFSEQVRFVFNIKKLSPLYLRNSLLNKKG